MNPLQTAVEQLYAVFGRYPLRTPIESCPCCRGPEYTRVLETKPLRELDEKDLMQYAGSAMTTIGDVDDFRHFLPRVFELLAQDRYYSPEIALGKLNIGEWRSWPVDEQPAIEESLREAWIWAGQGPLSKRMLGFAPLRRSCPIWNAPELQQDSFWEDAPHQLNRIQSWVSNLTSGTE